jgi:hypothetical protein
VVVLAGSGLQPEPKHFGAGSIPAPATIQQFKSPSIPLYKRGKQTVLQPSIHYPLFTIHHLLSTIHHPPVTSHYFSPQSSALRPPSSDLSSPSHREVRNSVYGSILIPSTSRCLFSIQTHTKCFNFFSSRRARNDLIS